MFAILSDSPDMKISAFLLATAACAYAAPFEIAEGDRVLLLGDALLERENTHGLLETRMHEQFPKVKFSVRNLSWSGETPRGWARASFDGPDKGWERLKEQIAEVRPTVAFLGFGMAASLQEMTDRSGDSTLNPDPVRYSAEPMSAARFKKELGELMDAVNAAPGLKGEKKAPVRFVLIAPIPHEDLTSSRPGTPNPAAHNKLLAQYAAAIKELATERGAALVHTQERWVDGPGNETDNGIQLTAEGYRKFCNQVVSPALEWATKPGTAAAPLTKAILRKDDLFFHQFRPANSTYLFGFRKHEQGRNAAEMPKFTPIIEAADVEIDRLKRGETTAAAPENVPAPGKAPEIPLPNFSVAEGFEVTLWADTNLIGKPVGMNWDPEGRLWVACSPVYPQILPGAHPDDKVVVLEDTDRDGKADKTTTFASDMLIAAGVAPDFASKTQKGKAPATTAAYVGSSTELVRAEDTDGDGKADNRRVVLSGFGTEDTHHTIHTLRWGPDGRLYFNQSIYIHSHMETPWGMVRLNSGGIIAYDPRTERAEVLARGFINTWGHAWDQWGQSFATDGAGFEGINWIIPGAMYRTYEGARRILPSVSPGSYPKYCGLELIQSPVFPAEWQGNAITCDFRAHRVTRFQINDLSKPADGKPAQSGYVTKELPAPITTTDASFRPIDVKLGPDGALYIADWTNPIINHGEVDFRDPRRDHSNGRIWRLAPKGATPVKWTAQAGKPIAELHANIVAPRMKSDVVLPVANGQSFKPAAATPANAWQVETARRVALQSPEELKAEITAVAKTGIGSDMAHALTAMEVALALGEVKTPEGVATSEQLKALSEATNALPATEISHFVRLKGESVARRALVAPDKKPVYTAGTAVLGAFSKATQPRVRLEAMRALSRIPTAESVALILEAATNAPGGGAKQTRSEDKGTSQFNQPAFADTADPYYGYAAWLSINELDDVFLKALAEGTWKPDTAAREEQFAWALGAIRPEKAGRALSAYFAQREVSEKGPWIELIGQAGGVGELSKVYALLSSNSEDLKKRVIASLGVAARQRNLKPEKIDGLVAALSKAGNEGIQAELVRLYGAWKVTSEVPTIEGLVGGKDSLVIGDAAAAALGEMGSKEATAALKRSLALMNPNGARALAVKPSIAASTIRALAARDFESVVPHLPFYFELGSAISKDSDTFSALSLWRGLVSVSGVPDKIASRIPANLPKESYAAGLRAARELGKRGDKLVAALTPLAGEAPAAPIPTDLTHLVDITKKNGNAAEGELVYRRAALTCTVCHAIGGAGGKVGPDLGTIGASAPLDYIIESTVNPAVKVKEGFHAIAATLNDGRTLSGTVAKETDRDMVLRDMTGGEQTVVKATIKEKTNIGSLMPPGLINTLNDREKANLFAFLSQLGKPGPFDSSKASVTRSWRVFPGDQVEAVVAGKADPSKGLPVYTYVDGRVTKELLEVPLAMAGSSPTIVASARFTVTGATKSRLQLPGITKAWLDGAPLAIASDPNPVVDLVAGEHTLVIKLDTAAIPAQFRAEVPEARFLAD